MRTGSEDRRRFAIHFYLLVREASRMPNIVKAKELGKYLTPTWNPASTN